MIEAEVGDITKVNDVNIIVNAANGIGVMGRGVAGAIAESAGKQWASNIREYAKKHGPFPEGSCYTDGDAGLLKRKNIKEVYHAVTMQYPGGITKMDHVLEALNECMRKAINNEHKSIAIPGLGTGIGGLDASQVARRMASELWEYRNKMNIFVIDTDDTFINSFNIFLRSKESISYGNLSK